VFAERGITVNGVPLNDEAPSGFVARIVAVLIFVAGIVRGAIGPRKARTKRDKG